MKLEVLLSVMNLDKKTLDKMKITSKCIVINQCDKESFEVYNNFNIFSYCEKGVSNSRNRALEKASEDIILFSDDDIVYDKDYEKIILEEFKKNKKADVIMFNLDSPNRDYKKIKKDKKIHIYNSLRYATFNIACRRKSIENIKFNPKFGPGAKFSNGSDTMFIVDLFKNKLNVYCSSKNIGTVYHPTSTWFHGYNEKFFYNKGALFSAINYRFRHFLFLQFLIRSKNIFTEMNFFEAYKNMLKGSKAYFLDRKKDESITSN